MSLYSFNLAPVVAIDISRSLVIVSRQFQLPIDFCTDFHRILTPNPVRVTNYVYDQAGLLSCTRTISCKLIHHHHVYHNEYISSCCPNPCLYSEGNMAFAKRAVKSDKQWGLVVKLMNSFAGPWGGTKSIHGSSYELVHCNNNRPVKKRAANISSFPQ